MTSGKRDDNRMDPDFERVAEAYRELPPEEPPAELDQAILASARRTRRDRSERPWNFGWLHALTTTAVVVLGVALILQIPERQSAEPLRVAKPPSAKLRDPASEFEPLRLPAPQDAAPGAQGAAKPTTVPQQAPAEERAEADRAALAAPRPPAAEPSAADTARRETGSPREPERQAQERDPERWLQRILELRQAGRTAAWREELAAFREAWPDDPLPPELAD